MSPFTENVLTTSMSKQRRFTKFSVFPKRMSTNPPGSFEFCGFSFRNQQQIISYFLGRDRGLVNNCSAAAGRAPNWTGRTLNTSYKFTWAKWAFCKTGSHDNAKIMIAVTSKPTPVHRAPTSSGPTSTKVCDASSQPTLSEFSLRSQTTTY